MAYINSLRRIGRKEGREEGREENAKSVILDLLKTKFGELPQWVHDKVDSAKLSRLHQWTIAIITTDSLEEIFSS